MSSRHIVYFHLLNDYSGSPKALLTEIREKLDEGCRIDLYTSSGGPLDSLRHPNLRHHVIPYSFRGRSLSTVFRFTIAQVRGFFASLSYAFSRDTEIYVNTILPVGAVLGARLARRKLTLHCHEDPKGHNKVYRLLARIVLPLADEVVCVSRFQASRMPEGLHVTIRSNRLSADFISSLQPDPERAYSNRNVLMLSALKPYKGVREFIELARTMPDINFTLVASDNQETVESWCRANLMERPENLTIHSCQADVSPFYNAASIVVNLTDPRYAVETCGLTILEARAARLPVIVPTCGGIAEVVTEGRDGYHIDLREKNKLREMITLLLSDRDLYLRLT